MFDTVLLFIFRLRAHRWCGAGREVGGSLGGHQLSPFKIFGCKTLRMRSFFVRSAGSSLFCKHTEKVYKLKFLLMFSLFIIPSVRWKCLALLGSVGSALAPSSRRTVRTFPLITAAWRAEEPFWRLQTKMCNYHVYLEVFYSPGINKSRPTIYLLQG